MVTKMTTLNLKSSSNPSLFSSWHPTIEAGRTPELVQVHIEDVSPRLELRAFRAQAISSLGLKIDDKPEPQCLSPFSVQGLR